jgi:hypothetical protein
LHDKTLDGEAVVGTRKIASAISQLPRATLKYGSLG